MDNEDVIRDEMENTRTSLTEKLETLEKKVTSTVENATANVAETVEAVKETVQETVSSVKETVAGTIGAVKDTVKEGVGAVKDAFDLNGHVQNHPWVMFGGSVAVGFALGKLLGSPAGILGGRESVSFPGTSAYHNGRHAAPDSEPEETSKGGLLSTLTPELEKVKSLAIGAVMGTLREIIGNAIPTAYRESIMEVVDGITEKLGGKVAKEAKSQEESKDWNSRWAQAS